MANFKILSIDGGGIRGLLSLALLQKLNNPETNLLQNVDLIAGTSTGGIIALGIAFGLPLAEMQNLYQNRGGEIFDDSWVRDISDIGGLIGSKYDNSNLIEILENYFKDTTLSQLSKKVLIPTFNLSAGIPPRWQPEFLHNFIENDTTLVDAALRTSAAPTYFESWGSYIDGGVAANDPSMAAVAQAIDAGIALPEIRVFSIGTGLSLSNLQGSYLDWGDSQWVKPLIQILLDAGAPVAERQCRQILKNNYLRLNPPFPNNINIALDDWKRADELVNLGNSVDVSKEICWLKQNWS